MKIWRSLTVSSVMLVLTLAMASAAGAQQGRGPRAGLQARLDQMIGAGQNLRGLQLTETQRTAIKAIVQAHKADFIETRKALLQARLALLKGDANGPSEFGAAQARMMALRLDLLNQVKTKLTPDQLDILQKRQQRKVDALEQRLNRLDSRQ